MKHKTDSIIKHYEFLVEHKYFDDIIFINQNSRPLKVENKVNLILVIKKYAALRKIRNV